MWFGWRSLTWLLRLNSLVTNTGEQLYFHCMSLCLSAKVCVTQNICPTPSNWIIRHDWMLNFHISGCFFESDAAVWESLFSGSVHLTHQWWITSFSQHHLHQMTMTVSPDSVFLIHKQAPLHANTLTHTHQPHTHTVRPMSGTAAHPFHFMVNSAGCEVSVYSCL